MSSNSARIDGKSLRALRVGRGLSLDDVARSAGVHESTVSRVETGFIVNPETLRVIEQAIYATVAARAQEAARQIEQDRNFLADRGMQLATA